MVAVGIPSFGGMIPALDDRKLPDTAASYSENVFLYAGTLRGLIKPRYLRDVPAGTTYSYRIPGDYDSGFRVFDNSLWLDFADSDTDVIRAPVFNDEFDRYYWASKTVEPRYNTRDRIASSDDSWVLGIPTPTVAPSVNVVGGSGDTVARSYVYTYVSAYGEEGPPSPPTLVTGFINGTWEIDWTAPDAGDMGVNRNLTHARVYRTVTSSAGVATYFFVGEFALADLDHDDTESDTNVSSAAQLETFSWTGPPEDLQGFIVMPNGIIAGWRGNELWFSEPYRPHAWPVAYVLTVPYPIVGLGIANQTLVVCTAGHPMTASGVNPAYITTSTLTTFEPCTSRGSIMSAPEGVYYASPTGLVLVQPGHAVNITKELITIDRWAELTPTLFKAARYAQAYFAYGAVAGAVFEETAFEMSEGAFVEEDETGTQQGVLIDPRDAQVAFNLLRHVSSVVGVMNDAWSSELMLIFNDELHWYDTRQPNPEYEVYRWKSKYFHSPTKKNFGAMKVYFTVPSSTPEQALARNNTLEQELAEDQYCLMRLYADDRHVLTWELRESGEIIRLPSGFKAEWWQVEFEGRVSISEMLMASTVKELQVA